MIRMERIFSKSKTPPPQAPKVRPTKAQGSALGTGQGPGKRANQKMRGPTARPNNGSPPIPAASTTGSYPNPHRQKKTPKAFRPPAQGWSHDRRPTLGPTPPNPEPQRGSARHLMPQRNKNNTHPPEQKTLRIPDHPDHPDFPTFRLSDFPTFLLSYFPTFRLSDSPSQRDDSI